MDDSLNFPTLNAGFENLLEVLNHPTFQYLRQNSQLGSKIRGCSACDSQESIGNLSLRMLANDLYPVKAENGPETSPNDIEYLELFLGDTCNLKCLTCNPQLSTSWQKEYDQLGWSFKKHPRRTFDLSILVSQLPNVKEIKFVGGEPLLSAEHQRVLEVLPSHQARNILLTYNTNCTLWPSTEILTLWKKFGRIDFRLSIDGVGKINEYIRFPSRWTKVNEIAEKFFNHSIHHTNFEIGVHGTVNAINVFSIFQLVQWFQQLNKRFSVEKPRYFYLYPLATPSFLSIRNLPNSIKEIASLSLGSDVPALQEIARYLQKDGDPTLMERLIKYLMTIDELRGNSYLECVPELSSISEKF